ncbi:MAG: bifunctional 4-hydroxy-2-oxoglutarate aldolase/2-dehydro-3-deoxy-phosphogluconate aldolase [Cyanobacteria bacterium P01_A01_bin.135]
MDLTPIRNTWLQQLKTHRAIAVIRADDADIACKMATAVAAGGMRLIEITWTTAQAAAVITKLRAELTDCQIGVGTILTEAALQEAIHAKAQFAFSPHTNPALITTACRHGLPVVPGALSPTEIVTAWQAGAASVKVFPVQSIGGAVYLRALSSPLGHIPLVPTGGVTLENAPALLRAGAVAVGLSTALFPKQALAQGDWEAIAARARMLVDAVSKEK